MKPLIAILFKYLIEKHDNTESYQHKMKTAKRNFRVQAQPAPIFGLPAFQQRKFGKWCKSDLLIILSLEILALNLARTISLNFTSSYHHIASLRLSISLRMNVISFQPSLEES